MPDSFELASLADSDTDAQFLSTSQRSERSNSVSSGTRNRSFSVASLALSFADSLGFTGGLLSTYNPDAPVLIKRLGLFSGLALVIGLQIGSGIFASPGNVSANTGSIGAALTTWVIAGLLAWTGALSYAELGAALPHNGGAQVYLQHVYGPFLSFLYSWCAIVLLKPGSAAIIAVVFGEYVNRAAFGALDLSPTLMVWLDKIIALVGLFLAVLLNSFSTRKAASFSNILVICKFAILIAVIVFGIVYAAAGAVEGHKPGAFDNGIWSNTSKDISQFATALYSALWAFDGWDNVNFIAGDLKEPTKTLPKIVQFAMPTVIIAYLIVNISYFLVLPLPEINATNTVALAFGDRVLGYTGRLIFACAVGLSCFGALNATMFSSARLIQSAARNNFIPRYFAAGEEGKVPLRSLLLFAVLIVVYVLVGNFEQLVIIYGVSGYLFYFITVLGVIILRFRDRTLYRPYKVWLSTPIIFCCVALFLMSRGIFSKPMSSIITLAFIAAGVPIYFITKNTDLFGKA
ncbi:hypothetical protein CANCADRAFT_4369 [Tortispora caseinolytica NRRL Y-17796]|uniref:Amino acid permease/ SLC12A domain-containing protein n=1 Tax=Tortispora caseinolytica NRRL Y-17796 TaxID=767744 RepID=A0A1E4TDA5_9ASCO|nr:hypothetical protein CANCADRAFT_4369 [Tortispora caseinolytica NRRL Y-17796]